MIMGIITFMIFAIVFGILVDKYEHILEVINNKITFDNTDVTSEDKCSVGLLDGFIDECIVEQCVNWCYYLSGDQESIGLLAKQKWTRRHITDSWDQFWGGSLACFLLGGYVIGASVYVYNNLEQYIKK